MSDYDIEKVSPRPWGQGKVYRDNPELRGWSGAGLSLADDRERIHIYSNMHPSDYGKSRQRVANVPEYNPNYRHDIKHIVHCVNAHDELVEALEGMIEISRKPLGEEEIHGRLHSAENLLTRIKNKE